METIKTYCIECDRDVEAPIVNIDDRLTIKGEEVLFKASVAKCPHCERAIGDATLEGKNLDTAYKQYCIEHGLMTKEEICDNLCFERTGKSLTGMTYVHADLGPIMPDYNFKLKNMEEQGFIVQVEDGWGVVMAPGSRALDLFTEDEHEMIDLTVDNPRS